MIIQEIKKHPVDFGCLAIIFLASLGGFFSFSHLPEVQKIIVVFTGLGYFLWGVFYHWHEGDLCFKIILEYLFLAIFATVAVIFLVLRQ